MGFPVCDGFLDDLLGLIHVFTQSHLRLWLLQGNGYLLCYLVAHASFLSALRKGGGFLKTAKSIAQRGQGGK